MDVRGAMEKTRAIAVTNISGKVTEKTKITLDLFAILLTQC